MNSFCKIDDLITGFTLKTVGKINLKASEMIHQNNPLHQILSKSKIYRFIYQRIAHSWINRLAKIKRKSTGLTFRILLYCLFTWVTAPNQINDRKVSYLKGANS